MIGRLFPVPTNRVCEPLFQRSWLLGALPPGPRIMLNDSFGLLFLPTMKIVNSVGVAKVSRYIDCAPPNRITGSPLRAPATSCGWRATVAIDALRLFPLWSSQLGTCAPGGTNTPASARSHRWSPAAGPPPPLARMFSWNGPLPEP